MKVILLKNVKSIGLEGEIKDVKEGYARNYLLPNKLAIFATENSLRAQKNKIERSKKAKEKLEKEKKKTAKTLKDLKISLKMKTDESGKLYGSINKKYLVKELTSQGHKIKENEILLKDAIKELGKYTVPIKIGNKEVQLYLNIVKE